VTVFVRVRDVDTGHQFDVPAGDKRVGGCLKPLNRAAWPPSDHPRRPKHRRLKGVRASGAEPKHEE
jgi:hypothetical protein